MASTVIASILGIATLCSTLSQDDALGPEIGPRRTPIDWRHLRLNHASQRVTTSTSNPGNSLSVHEDGSPLLKDRLNRKGSTVGELIISDPEVVGKETRRQLVDVRRDLLDLDSAATAPAERAIRVERVHPGFARLRVAG
jgi:hypothetical protein